MSITWTTEMDVELIASFIGAEMHNWFVFCRKWHITTDESSSRMKELRASVRYKKLLEDARAIYKLKESEHKLNSKRLQNILDKGTPASKEDKEWLARSEW